MKVLEKRKGPSGKLGGAVAGIEHDCAHGEMATNKV